MDFTAKPSSVYGDGIRCTDCITEGDYTFSNYHDGYVTGGSVVVCDCCGGIFHCDSSIWCDGANGYCGNCESERDNESDDDDDDDDGGDSSLPAHGRLNGYHCGPKCYDLTSLNPKAIPTWRINQRSPAMAPINKRLQVGVELEVECKHSGTDVQTKTMAIHSHLALSNLEQCAKFEYDGSISHGFEMISGVTDIDRVTDIFGWLDVKTLTNGLLSSRKKSCGLHIHVCDHFTSVQRAKLLLFIHEKGNLTFLSTLGGRPMTTTGYAKVNPKADCLHGVNYYLKHGGDINSERHEAINFNRRLKTAEFRFPKGTLNKNSFLSRVQLAWAVSNYFLSPFSDGMNLSYTKFVAWLMQSPCKAYCPNLVEKIREGGYVTLSETKSMRKLA
jgi:hypothetical protein